MGLADCVLAAGRPAEAEELFERVLAVQQAKDGGDSLQVASLALALGRRMLDAGHSTQARGLLSRSLDLRQSLLGPDDEQVRQCDSVTSNRVTAKVFCLEIGESSCRADFVPCPLLSTSIKAVVEYSVHGQSNVANKRVQ